MHAVRVVLSILTAVVVGLLGLILLFVMLSVTGLPLCEDREALRTADECITTGSTERAIGLIAGWLGVISAVLTVVFAIMLASRGGSVARLATAAAMTPVLGLLAIAFQPVSF